MDYGERLLNDLRLVCDDSTLAYANLSFTDSKRFAENMVEMLLTGTSARREHVMDGRDRETFYVEQHAKHHALGETDKLWNDNLDD